MANVIFVAFQKTGRKGYVYKTEQNFKNNYSGSFLAHFQHKTPLRFGLVYSPYYNIYFIYLFIINYYFRTIYTEIKD